MIHCMFFTSRNGGFYRISKPRLSPPSHSRRLLQSSKLRGQSAPIFRSQLHIFRGGHCYNNAVREFSITTSKMTDTAVPPSRSSLLGQLAHMRVLKSATRQVQSHLCSLAYSPSAFGLLTTHHNLPLSRTASKMSPFEKDVSDGSLASAVSEHSTQHVPTQGKRHNLRLYNALILISFWGPSIATTLIQGTTAEKRIESVRRCSEESSSRTYFRLFPSRFLRSTGCPPCR